MRFRVIDKLRIFDFDDTLVQTDAKIYVTNKGLALSSLEFGKYEKENDDVYDFTDFRSGHLKNPQATSFFKTAFKRIVSGNSDIMILTARPQEYANEIEDFLSPHVSMDRVKIVGGAETPEMKKAGIEKMLGKYKDIRFYDDSDSNIAAVNTLKDKAAKMGTKLVTQVVKK